MPPHNKRKLNKSGEKVSPKDKKSKSVKEYMKKMASHEEGECVTENSKTVSVTNDKWQSLMDKIEKINVKTEEIKKINNNIDGFRKEVKELNDKCQGIENSLDFYIKKSEAIEKKLEDLGKTQELISLLEHELKASEEENRVLKEQILRQELYSRRDNLVFEGILEQADQPTEETLKTFFTSVLGLNQEECQALQLSRCHRLGRQSTNTQPRSIIARFVLDKDKIKVWQKRSLLKGTSFMIREDFPLEIINRRKLMYPLYIEARKRDSASRLIADKITYNKRTYSYQKAQELAQTLHFFEKGIIKGEDYIAFHGRASIYSNFFPCSLKLGETNYSCAEQLYQHERCLFHGDARAARSVMLQTDPVDMKKIGRATAFKNPKREDQWIKQDARKTMETAVRLKFSQNDILLSELKKTTQKFVEANQYDSVWGIGLPITDKNVLNPGNWKGTNWLGETLTVVRSKLNK